MLQTRPRRPLSAIRAFLMDMDGTIYLGTRLLPGAKGFFRLLARRGIPHLFFTNNSSSDRTLYRDKLRGMGLDVAADQIITSGEATALYLATRTPYRRLYVLGTPSLEREFRDAGFTLADDRVDAVVLGFDKTLTYAKLERAVHLLRAATGRKPVAIGKPNRTMVQMALRKLGPGYRPANVAIVGDRLYTDVRMGRRAGLTAILVLSGETRREELATTRDVPDYVFASIRELGAELKRET